MNIKCNVLLLYIEMIPSVKLCGDAQFTELEKMKKINYRSVQIESLTEEDTSWADIVIVCRFDSIRQLQIVKSLRKIGKYVIYMMDDDLLNVPNYVSTSAHYQRKLTKRMIISMMQCSNALLSPSDELLKKYSCYSGKTIKIEEPAILPGKYVEHDENTILIGFAGSVDRTSDIEMILKNVLKRIYDKYGSHVQFCFFGAIPSFAESIDAITKPYCNSYEDYLNTVNGLNWDIGLAPMPNTEFHSCKHYIKYIEYAENGIVGLYSSVKPYTKLKDRQFYGSFCDNTEESWYEGLCYWIDNREEREIARRRLVAIANGTFSINNIASDFFESNREMFNIVRHNGRQVSLKRIKIQSTVCKIILGIWEQGWKLPLSAINKILNRLT